MPQSHVVSGLVKKRREISGEVTALRKRLKSKEADLSAIDLSIKLFDPDYDLRTIKDKRVVSRGNPAISVRAILELLRDAEHGLSLDDPAIGLLERQGYPYDDKDKAILKENLSKTLNKLKIRDRVARCGVGWCVPG